VEKKRKEQGLSEYRRFANLQADEIFRAVLSSAHGLSQEEAEARLKRYGYNEPARKEVASALKIILYKLFNPINLMLLVIVLFSLLFGEDMSAIIVSVMIVVGIVLDFTQQYRSQKAVEKLEALVRTTVTVIRSGKEHEISLRDLVPGDVVDLHAGSLIPADLRILSCKDFFVNEAALTGESYPVQKSNLAEKSGVDLSDMAFMGSSVVSGTALAIVLKTGASTQFGQIASQISSAEGNTAFDRGIRQFTIVMARFIFYLVVAIFIIISVFKQGQIKDALLFSLAVAAGLTPEMLPMLVTLNLSRGAIAMSRKKVIVKRLNSIQNLGAMDVLCTDKTGTLTKNEISLEVYCDVNGRKSEEVLEYAYIVSSYQTGLKNLVENAILKHEHIAIKPYIKVDELPFDFVRKIMSVVVKHGSQHFIFCKGAPEEIYKRCSSFEVGGKAYPVTRQKLACLKKEYDQLSSEGYIVLAVAYKKIKSKSSYSKEDESGLILKGYMGFLDPPKPSARKILAALHANGVEVKILTGDSPLVTRKICEEVGLRVKGVRLGSELSDLGEEELSIVAESTTIFARLTPMQKERVIRALQENKHVVGYLGDGINDAPSLRIADVGISVNNAVDIAKESADIILLERSLMVLNDGCIEGRRTFCNITKYIKMGASSNFGNMLSVAAATLFLPFLPMLPIQVLLNNFLYDMSQATIPTDTVDPEFLKRPKPWNIDFVKKFMIFIGPISSIFDFATYALLWFIFAANTLGTQALFQTGWFVESLCSQILAIYVIRTNKFPFIESRPSRLLLMTTLFVLGLGILLPFTSAGLIFGFTPLPPLFFIFLVVMMAGYLWLTQKVKAWLVRRYGYQ
jgi:P-type Mg2+ transporter